MNALQPHSGDAFSPQNIHCWTYNQFPPKQTCALSGLGQYTEVLAGMENSARSELDIHSPRLHLRASELQPGRAILLRPSVAEPPSLHPVWGQVHHPAGPLRRSGGFHGEVRWQRCSLPGPSTKPPNRRRAQRSQSLKTTGCGCLFVRLFVCLCVCSFVYSFVCVFFVCSFAWLFVLLSFAWFGLFVCSLVCPYLRLCLLFVCVRVLALQRGHDKSLAPMSCQEGAMVRLCWPTVLRTQPSPPSVPPPPPPLHQLRPHPARVRTCLVQPMFSPGSC